MKRRAFITLLGSAAVACCPVVARTQSGVRRIGVVIGDTETGPIAAALPAFRQEMQKLGWIDRNNVHISYHYVAPDPKVIKTVAAELAALAPDLIVSNTNLVTEILHSEIRSTPIVFVGVSDPIGSGFVTDLSRPTGNLTGFANFELSMGGKWLEKLREVAPRVERIGFILHPETPPNIGFLKSAEDAAATLNMKVIALGVHSGVEIEHALAAFSTEPRGGLIIAPHAVTFANSDLIVALAARYRLPAIYPLAFYAKAGGLISYGNDLSDQFRQAAVYVDRILRGTQLNALPVQLPTKFEFVLNLKTAQTLGLEVPLFVQQLADEVIE